MASSNGSKNSSVKLVKGNGWPEVYLRYLLARAPTDPCKNSSAISFVRSKAALAASLENNLKKDGLFKKLDAIADVGASILYIGLNHLTGTQESARLNCIISIAACGMLAT